MSITAERINKIAKLFNAKHYLEIGVSKGDTFNSVNIENKTAVDPAFRFNTEEFTTPLTTFFPCTSDVFFDEFSQKMNSKPYTNDDGTPFTFDIIFIDGLHTFEQSYRDFENSIKYSHKDTVWIIDDTIPADPYSALPSQSTSYAYRTRAQLAGRPWHGDVFKTVFAIHDFHPEFSYCTHTNAGNPQTVLWQTPHNNRTPVWGNIQNIAALSYFDLLEFAHLLVPVPEDLMFEMIGLQMTPNDYKTTDDYKKIVRPIKTLKEITNAKQLIEAQQVVTEKFTVQLDEAKKSIDSLLPQVKKLKNQVKTLQAQLAEEKARRRRIKNSFSWKITSPLRAFIKLFSNNSGV